MEISPSASAVRWRKTMALVVEQGGGSDPAANAYIDLAYADAHHALRDRSGWAGSAETKAAAVLAATEYLDLSFRWRGERLIPGQPLGWPRRLARDDEGVVLAGVPAVLRLACAELAWRALSGPLLPDLAAGGRPVREKVGEVELAYAPGASALPRFPAIERLLAGLVRPPDPMERA
ncbi:MAG: hypothetical protein KKC98_05425 [Alphaproteobacteria bacterium]|nr:hypothetical protein [Alphaproteobacteria bacterium]MBU1812232.1 hypothetical protein [Alphaproteobacteria bacterium]